MRAVAALSTMACLAGCAALVGGLEEGRSRPDAALDATTPEPIDAGADCGGPWLEGFQSRAAYDVTSKFPAAVTDFTLSVSLDTHRLIERGVLRADGADLRVTGDDGRSPLRFLLPERVDSEAAKLWVRLDVPPGTSRLYVYFNGPPNADDDLHSDVFFDGIVPPFDPALGAWHSNGALNQLTDAGATPVLRFGADRNDTVASWCFTSSFPAGHAWQLVFDLTPHVRTQGTYFVSAGGVDLFATAEIEPRRDLVTMGEFGIESGERHVCFAVHLDGPNPVEGDEISATFSRPRVRVFVRGEPTVQPIGIENAPCLP